MSIQRPSGGESASPVLERFGGEVMPEECRGQIVGISPPMVRLRGLLAKVACVDSPVLIYGESGTGKRTIAEALHFSGRRSEGPLVIHPCHAAEEESRALLERQFACAKGGTLLLEEVCSLPASAQISLLQRLQEREKPGVRIIATSSAPLAEAVASGEMRRDLYFVLHVVPLEVPPLRERLGDLPMLVNQWAEQFSRRNGACVPPLSAGVIEGLRRYRWPGNLRELESALERAVVLSGGSRPLEVEDFSFLERGSPTITVQNAKSSQDEPLLTLDELERRHVLRMLEHTRQNRTRAASLLNISVRTLRNKLHQYRSAGLLAPHQLSSVEGD